MLSNILENFFRICYRFPIACILAFGDGWFLVFPSLLFDRLKVFQSPFEFQYEQINMLTLAVSKKKCINLNSCHYNQVLSH